MGCAKGHAASQRGGYGQWDLTGTETGKCCWQSTVVADASLKYPLCPDMGTEVGVAQPSALGGTACPSPIAQPSYSVQPQMLN